jgi:hypothetical protein
LGSKQPDFGWQAGKEGDYSGFLTPRLLGQTFFADPGVGRVAEGEAAVETGIPQGIQGTGEARCTVHEKSFDALD